MSSLISEHQVWNDEGGLPIVNGYIHIGTVNTDPTQLINKITIYSDRDLSVSLSNPQRTDAYGRAVNKIYVPDKYSIEVQDSDQAQQYNNLDNGELSETGITTLNSVSGVNTITASAIPAIVALTDKQVYTFTSTGTITGATTLKIDGTATTDIRKNHTEALIAGDIEINQVVQVVYNETSGVFELVSNVNPELLDEDDLISDSNTQAATQQSIKAYIDGETEISEHTKAGNIQILSGVNDVNYPGFDIKTSLTEAAWESIGRTGSGADNIWASLDDIPSSASIIIVDISTLIESALIQGLVNIHAVTDDIVSPVSNTETNRIVFSAVDESAADEAGSMHRVFIPVSSSQIFKMYYIDSVNTSSSYVMYYRGFITN